MNLQVYVPTELTRLQSPLGSFLWGHNADFFTHDTSSFVPKYFSMACSEIKYCCHSSKLPIAFFFFNFT